MYSFDPNFQSSHQGLRADGDLIEAIAQSMIAESCFSAALEALSTGIGELYARNWPAIRSFGEQRRFAIATLCAHMDLAAAKGWCEPLTRAGLMRVAPVGQFGSRGGLSAIVNDLIRFGYLAERTSDGDRRKRPLSATMLCLDHLAKDASARLAAAAAMNRCLPFDAATAYRMLAGYLSVLVSSLIDQGRQLLSRFPEALPFADYFAGFIYLLALLVAAETEPRGSPVPAGIAPASRILCVSRTHLLRILYRAEQKGVVAIVGRGRVAFLPEAHGKLRLFAAFQIAVAVCALEIQAYDRSLISRQ